MNSMNAQLNINCDPKFATGNVLIIDQSESNLLSLRALLADKCNCVTCANSGNKALTLLLKNNNYSLIFLAVQIPESDGFDTLKLLKKHPKTRDIPVICITADQPDPKSLHLGYEIGAVDSICHPIDPLIICAKVAVFVALHSAKNKLKDEMCFLRDHTQTKQNILIHSAE